MGTSRTKPRIATLAIYIFVQVSLFFASAKSFHRPNGHNEFNALYSKWYILRFVCPLTKTAILILDSNGNRILANYYQPPHLPPQPQQPALSPYITTPQPNPYPTLKDQKNFEKGLFEKTKKQSSDVILYDNRLVVYKQGVDCVLYVVGGAEENEIMLYLVVVALKDSLDSLLK